MEERLLKQAAELLAVSEKALHADLTRAQKPPAPAPSQAIKESKTSEHVVEEIQLAELLLTGAPEACALVEEYLLPFGLIHNPLCLGIIQQCVDQRASGHSPVINNDELSSEDLVRFSASLQMNPDKLRGEHADPILFAQTIIRLIHRKHLEKKRKQLQQQIEQASSEQRSGLEKQKLQLTEDIRNLRKDWEHALTVLQH